MPTNRLTSTFAALAISLGAGCVSRPARPDEPAAGVSLIVSPETLLVDQQASIVAKGLRPHQTATLVGTLKRDSVRALISTAVFRANGRGVIDVAITAADSGTYTGVDAMGPIWSMAPGTDRTDNEIGVVHFDLVVDGERRSAARLARLDLASQTRRIPVRDAGLVGTLFIAPHDHPRPVVIVIGGSEGGLESAEGRAAPFVAHGYAALALAYFRTEGLPRELVNIPLEYFERAISWIGTQAELDASRVALVGVSRGAEAALLVATRSARVRAVVAYAPSSMVWGGLDRANPDSHVAAWTAGGIALESGVGRRLLDSPDSVMRFGIPVERIHGPVLLIAGDSDRVWPSATMANQIMARLRAYGHSQNSAALIYHDAGHGIAFPFIPVAPRLSLGGTPSGLARADRESWHAVLAFLDQALKRD